MLFESTLRHLVSNLLIEAKADVLQARHPHIDVHALAVLDPSPTKKYLEWMIKVADGEEILDMEELGSVIKQFDSAIQRLRGPQRDINSYKSLDDLQATLKDVGTQSKTKQKQSTKASGSQHVGTVDEWDVYFITSHEAAMLLGKGTKWCITGEDGKHWDGYVRNVKFFYAIRKQPKGDPLDKIAYACYLKNNKIEVFDAQDRSINMNNKSIIKLTNFINEIKTKYSDYTATSQNSRMPFINNKLYGIAKYSDGTIAYYVNDVLHREDGPAIESANGTKEWLINNKRHREDGPAIEWANGAKEWYLNGKRHREDGPAIEWANDTKEWYLNGLRHRVGGPAFERVNSVKEWWLKGKRHREDGPAVEWINGRKEWWLYGTNYSEQKEYERALEFRRRIYTNG